MNKINVCSHSTCDKPATARGMCSKHYAAKWRSEQRAKDKAAHPELYYFGRKRHDSAPRRWIERHKDWKGTDCLIWPYRSQNGTPMVTLQGEKDWRRGSIGAASEIMREEIDKRIEAPDWPKGLPYRIIHTCGNAKGGCLNPGHMHIVPVNLKRRPDGKPYIPRVPTSKPVLPWSLALVERIVELSLVLAPADIFRELTK